MISVARVDPGSRTGRMPVSLLFFLVAYLAGGCTPVLPPPDLRPPILSPAGDNPLRARILSEMASGDTRNALLDSRALPPGQERKKLVALIRRERIDALRDRASAAIKSGNTKEAWNRLLEIRGQSEQEYRSLLLSFDRSHLTTMLREAIDGGQEEEVIEAINTIKPFFQITFRPLLAEATGRLAERMFLQGHIRRAALLSRRSLAIDRKNPRARILLRSLLKERDDDLAKGLDAYRHQRIGEAMAFWQAAARIDPANVAARRYLRKARSIKDRLDRLKRSTAVRPQSP